MLKRSLVLPLAFLLMLGLAACAGTDAASVSSGSPSEGSAVAQPSDNGKSQGSAADSQTTASESSSSASEGVQLQVREDGSYSDRDSVALYIHLYGHLPSNYISKSKARAAGWVNTEGNLWDVLPGKSIGGSEFYNDDGLLPDARGRRWTECDIDYEGGFRNAKRIVYSNDGLVFYTDDHYQSFEQLY